MTRFEFQSSIHNCCADDSAGRICKFTMDECVYEFDRDADGTLHLFRDGAEVTKVAWRTTYSEGGEKAFSYIHVWMDQFIKPLYEELGL